MPDSATTRADDPGDERVHLHLLGAPRLSRAGTTLVELNALDAALLALVAIERHSIGRDRAAALLWPDADAGRAANSLRQRLFRLRRVAGVDIVTGARQLALGANVQHDVQLLLGEPMVDVLPDRGELLGHLEPSQGSELSDWLASARERWRSVRREVLTTHLLRLQAEGRLAEALRIAERLLEHEPLSEQAHRDVMRLHYLRGDRAAALQAFGRCQDLLLEKLGQAPLDETLSLAALITRSGVPESRPAISPPPVVLRRPPRLVGREAEWASMDRAEAEHQAVLLVGEAGMGKTRLLNDRMTARGLGLRVDARPGDRQMPYAVLARLLRSLLEQHGEAVEGALPADLHSLMSGTGFSNERPLQTVRLHAAVGQALRRAHAVGLSLVAIDDLQFADQASLEILLPLALDKPGPRWLLAVRGGERPPELVRWQRDADSSGRLLERALSPLPLAAVRDLLASLALPTLAPDAWAEPLRLHTGGNPLFLLETLRVMAEQGADLSTHSGVLPWPETVGSLIERRLDRLGPAALRLAQVAALADVDFGVTLAAQVLQVHEIELAQPWRELQAAGLFADAGFAHDLVREAALRSVPAAIARALHARLAVAVAAATSAPARIARHHQLAAQWPDAAQAWRMAAAQALSAGRRREEAEFLQAADEDAQRAAQTARSRGDAAAARALEADALQAACDRIGALVQVAGGDELRAALDALERRPAEGRLRALKTLAVAEAQIVFGEFAAVASEMPAALALLGSDEQARLLATRRLAVACLNLGRFDDAAALLQAWLPRLDVLPDDRSRYEFLGEFGTVLERCNRRREGFAQLQRGITLALAADDPGSAATMHVNLGINRVYWGDAQAAIQATEQGLALRQRHDEVAGLASGFEMSLGAMCRDAGRLGEAIERLERAHAAFTSDGNRLWTANTAHHLGLLWVQLGQWARAARVLRISVDGLAPFIASRLLAVRALLDGARGKPSLPGLTEARDRLRDGDRVDVRLGIELERLRLLDPEPAQALAREVATEALQCELMGHELGARVLELDARRRGGDARKVRRPALALCAELEADSGMLAPSGFYRPALCWHLAQVLLEAGSPREAERLWRRAQADVDRSTRSLPDPFRAGFLRDNAVNRALWTEPAAFRQAAPAAARGRAR